MTQTTIGLIGLDTSHVSAFTRLLNHADDPHHVPGGRVVAAWPGGSPDFELSRSRVAGFTEELASQHGVEMLDSPEAVAERCDLVMITAVDGRVHRSLVQRVIASGKPMFIDKPLATSLDDARAIVDLAAEHDVAMMSCSSLRYADNLTAALQQTQQLDGVDLFGPLALQPTQPGYFWYGIHSVEIVIAAMGPAVDQVHTLKTDRHDTVMMRYDDGRVATIHGLRESHGKFGAVLHTPESPVMLDLSNNPRPYYASLLQAMLPALPQGAPPIPAAEMLAVIAVIEAINQSRDTGDPVKVART